MPEARRRRPRENGWLDAGGVTHHIDTRRIEAYHRDVRTATCGAGLRLARRAPVGRVDCMTCIVRVSRRPRLAPRPEPTETTPSWWTKGGDRHVRSANDPWRAACGVSLRAAHASGNPPNCLACGAQPSAVARTRSWRTPDGARHEMRLDDPKFARRAPCGADLIEAQVARKAPNCVGCRAASGQKGKNRGRLPRAERR
jgi:hypothetical protein